MQGRELPGRPQAGGNGITRRRLLQGGAGLLAGGWALSLAGCERPEEALVEGEAAPAAPADPPADGDVTRIDFAWWGGDRRNQLTNDVLDVCDQRHPHITLGRQAASFDPYWERLAVQAAAGNQPDWFQMQTRYVAEFGGRGALLPLDDYVDDGLIDVTHIPEAVLEAGRIDGDLYMVAFSYNFRGVWYDADHLQAAGLEIPEVDWTWQELFDLLVAWRESLPDGVWPAADNISDDQAFYCFIRGQGKQVYDGQALGFEPEDLAEWFTYWQDLRAADATPPPDVQAEQSGDTLEDSIMARGVVALNLGAPHQLHTVDSVADNELRLTAMPVGEAGRGEWLLVNGMSISPHTQHPELAAEMIDCFINDPDAALAYEADHGLPSSNEMQDVVADILPPGQRDAFELSQVISAEIPPHPPEPMGATEVQGQLDRLGEEVGFGRMTIDQAVDEFFREAQRVLGG